MTEPGATKQKTVFHSFKMRFYMVASLGVLAYFAYLGSSDEPVFSFLASETVSQSAPVDAPKPEPKPIQPVPAPSPSAPASVAVAEDSPILSQGYLSPDVAARFWIAGSIHLSSPTPDQPDNMSLILTDGAHTVVAQVPASHCERRGVLFCVIDGVRFSDVPVRSSTIKQAVAANAVKQ